MSGRGTTPASAEAAMLAIHRRTEARRFGLVAVLVVLAVAAFLLDLATGPSDLPLGEAVAALLSASDATARAIVVDIRLPAALAAVLSGVALAVCGAEMQTIYDNPLADGLTLGVSPAATFGTALTVIAGVGLPGVPAAWAVPFNAFAACLGSTLLLQSLGRVAGGGSQTFVLLGIALVFAFNALTALLQFVASPAALQQLVFWLLGSLAGARWDTVLPLSLVVLVLLPTAFAAAPAMTALRFGEERAASFGLDVRRLRLLSMLRVSLLTGACVSVIGIVGFVGLVAPHAARLLVGEDHRFLLPVSALVGALVMSLASVVAKLAIAGVVVPLGIVTALVGLPVFFALILLRRTA